MSPLQGLKYINKVKGGLEETESRKDVDVLSFTDSVYRNAPGTYKISSQDQTIEFTARNLNDVVVWNPNAEAGRKMADMEEGGW